ncbi:TPA: rhamnulokinase, partial [Streptococcus suis]|nr:rhamnulokinase [Streptococcus suis]
KKSFLKLGKDFSYDEITEMVNNVESCVPTFDTDASTFASPGNMIEKIVCYFSDKGIKVSTDPAILFKIVYQSLAEKYKEVIIQLEEITGNIYKRIDLIGGGSKSEYFSQLVADVTGKTVVTGLYEATSIGNALVQFKALGYVEDMKEAKKLVKESITFNHFYPKKEEKNDTLS